MKNPYNEFFLCSTHPSLLATHYCATPPCFALLLCDSCAAQHKEHHKVEQIPDCAPLAREDAAWLGEVSDQEYFLKEHLTQELPSELRKRLSTMLGKVQELKTKLAPKTGGQKYTAELKKEISTLILNKAKPLELECLTHASGLGNTYALPYAGPLSIYHLKTQIEYMHPVFPFQFPSDRAFPYLPVRAPSAVRVLDSVYLVGGTQGAVVASNRLTRISFRKFVLEFEKLADMPVAAFGSRLCAVRDECIFSVCGACVDTDAARPERGRDVCQKYDIPQDRWNVIASPRVLDYRQQTVCVLPVSSRYIYLCRMTTTDTNTGIVTQEAAIGCAFDRYDLSDEEAGWERLAILDSRGALYSQRLGVGDWTQTGPYLLLRSYTDIYVGMEIGARRAMRIHAWKKRDREVCYAAGKWPTRVVAGRGGKIKVCFRMDSTPRAIEDDMRRYSKAKCDF